MSSWNCESSLLSRDSDRIVPIRAGVISRFSLGVALAWLSLLFPLSSHAQFISFILESDPVDRTITTDTIDVDGVAYISLPLLMEHAGGAYNLLPTRLRVDYRGTTAWLRAGDVRVHALSIFSLRYPILNRNGDTLIAALDVLPFFLKAFRATIYSDSRLENSKQAAEPETDEDETDTRLVSLPRLGEENTIVVIDPGHGGYDAGLQGPGGYEEKTLSMDIARRLKPILENMLRVRVLLTRSEDAGLSTSDRASFANDNGGTVLISIHAGGTMSPGTTGIAVYYGPRNASPGSTRLAGRIVSSSRRVGDEFAPASEVLARLIGGELARTTSSALRGVLEVPARLLREAAMPSVMIEVGCLTNPSDEALLRTGEYRERVAQGIADGLSTFFRTKEAAGPTGDTSASERALARR